jgi:hypothetical protein
MALCCSRLVGCYDVVLRSTPRHKPETREVGAQRDWRGLFITRYAAVEFAIAELVSRAFLHQAYRDLGHPPFGPAKKLRRLSQMMANSKDIAFKMYAKAQRQGCPRRQREGALHLLARKRRRRAASQGADGRRGEAGRHQHCPTTRTAQKGGSRLIRSSGFVRTNVMLVAELPAGRADALRIKGSEQGPRRAIISKT